MLGWVTKEVIRQKKRIEACRSCSNTHTHSHTILQYWTLYSCPHRLQIHFALVSSGLALMAKQIMWEVLQLLLFLYVLVCVCVLHTAPEAQVPTCISYFNNHMNREKKKEEKGGWRRWCGWCRWELRKMFHRCQKKNKKKSHGEFSNKQNDNACRCQTWGWGGVYFLLFLPGGCEKQRIPVRNHSAVPENLLKKWFHIQEPFCVSLINTYIKV